MTSGVAYRPRAGKDDGFIYFFRDEAIWRTPLDGDGEEMAVPNVINGLSFMPARGGVYFGRLNRAEAKFEILFWSSADGEIIRTGVEAPARYWPGTASLGLSSDERQLLFSRLEPLREDLMLAEGLE